MTLRPGKTARVELTLSRRDSYWHDAEHSDWRLPTGPFDIRLGASSYPVRLSRCLEMRGNETPLRALPPFSSFTDSRHQTLLQDLKALT